MNDEWGRPAGAVHYGKEPRRGDAMHPQAKLRKRLVFDLRLIGPLRLYEAGRVADQLLNLGWTHPEEQGNAK